MDAVRNSNTQTGICTCCCNGDTRLFDLNIIQFKPYMVIHDWLIWTSSSSNHIGSAIHQGQWYEAARHTDGFETYKYIANLTLIILSYTPDSYAVRGRTRVQDGRMLSLSSLDSSLQWQQMSLLLTHYGLIWTSFSSNLIWWYTTGWSEHHPVQTTSCLLSFKDSGGKAHRWFRYIYIYIYNIISLI